MTYTDFKCWPVAVLAAVSMLGSISASGSESNSAEDAKIAAGPLDGLVFEGALGPDGEPKDTLDTFVFENGTFVSRECELRCKYPARPYFVRVNGNRTEFISETKCPYKDARITWRGTVEGDRLKGKAIWLVKRWYWTIEDTYEFEARLIPDPAASANTD